MAKQSELKIHKQTTVVGDVEVQTTVVVPTPESDKMLAVKEQSEPIGAFLDWLMHEADMTICQLNEYDQYIPVRVSIEAMLAQGKQSICWRCGEVCYVALTRTGREIKRPHCLTCVKVYNKRDVAGKPVIDVKKIAEMSWDDLLGGDQRFVPNSKKKKDED